MQTPSSLLLSGHSLDPLQTPSLGMHRGSLLLSGHQKLPCGQGEVAVQYWARVKLKLTVPIPVRN